MFAALEIFDLDAGRSRPLLETEIHIEAPNWTPDGAALIVNAAGRIYRVALDAPALVPIDTGKLDQINNDHGPSPDGAWLAVSDSSAEGQSCIYTLPGGGGIARRITSETPSWWHGWSPDGATLAYTCRRDGAFGIAMIPARGGTERVLISGGGHYDGPDFTPDGRHIWFNSDRAGAMKLWRMRPDGRQPEQMTTGTSADWFPHPSPDGRNVVFLSYPPGTRGHPFGLPVELRLMAATGGASRHLLSLHGGQGSLNSPSWAPDARRFAFVRYEPKG